MGINHLTFHRMGAGVNRIVTIHGAEVFCVGVNNEGAEKRIRGGSVDLWYADEPTLYDKHSFEMCQMRCRRVNDKGELEFSPIMLSFNPDDDVHFVYKLIPGTEDCGEKFTDDTNYWRFFFEDNPTITKKYIDDISTQYSGLMHERMIKGRRTGDPSRKIVPEFDSEAQKVIVREVKMPKYFKVCGALDPGFSHMSAYLVGYYDYTNGVPVGS